MIEPSTRYDAVVLAGGRSSRHGGVDKTRMRIAGRPMLDLVLAAARGAEHVVVAGPRRPVSCEAPVSWARERPAGGGPLAALAAALPMVGADVVVVLAADLPRMDAATVKAILGGLVAATSDVAGCVAVDADGHPQWLASAWRTQALRHAMPGKPAGGSLGRVMTSLAPVRVAIDGDVLSDCDTPADLAATREACHEPLG